jgi:hypothetical protein
MNDLTDSNFPRLISRAWNVLRTPVQDLVKTLGIELPSSPIVSLTGIKADQITLQWGRPQSASSVAKYNIQVNGITGTCNYKDTENREARLSAANV